MTFGYSWNCVYVCIYICVTFKEKNLVFTSQNHEKEEKEVTRQFCKYKYYNLTL